MDFYGVTELNREGLWNDTNKLTKGTKLNKTTFNSNSATIDRYNLRVQLIHFILNKCGVKRRLIFYYTRMKLWKYESIKHESQWVWETEVPLWGPGIKPRGANLLLYGANQNLLVS